MPPDFEVRRRRGRAVGRLVAWAAAWATVAGAAAADAPWQVGVARAVITPTTPVWLAGYGSRREPDGAVHDLWAKALAFEAADGGRAVLVATDFQGVPASMSDRVFARLEAEHGLDRRRVMLAFSHNHSSPRLGDDLLDYYPVDAAQEAVVARYTDECVDTCVAVVARALAAVAPATVRVGAGRAGFAVNRRDNREADVPGMLARGEPLRGVTDHAVPVLTVTRPDGRLEAVLFGYACHPTVLAGTTYSGDYPGFAQLALERSHPGVTALFVNTCGGDQNPLPRRSVELCERYGMMLAAGVEEALRGPLEPVSARLRTAFVLEPVPYERVVTARDLEAAAADPSPIKARWAARLLGRLAAGETFATAYPYPLHAWRLGEQTLFIGMGGETVVDYAVRFKRQWGPGTWVLGYTDDMAAYVPSRRVWEEGGYEGGSHLYEYGRPAFRWAGGVEDVIATAVAGLVAEVGPPAAAPATKTIVTVSASTPDLPRKGEGDVVELDDGRLLLVSMEFGGDGSDFATTRLVAHESADGGRTWGGHRVVAETAPGDVNVYSPNLIRARDGGILLMFHRHHGPDAAVPGSFTLHAWRSDDGGRRFGPYAEFFPHGDLQLCNGTVKRLASGRLLLPACAPATAAGAPAGSYVSTVLRSDDDGRTWAEAADRISLPLRGAMEPHVEQAGDGRVLMVMRNQIGTLQISESGDDGVHWSAPRSAGLAAPESCPELTRIPATGDLLLIWNHGFDPAFRSHYGRRSPLTAAVSRDHGRTWGRLRDIETDPRRAFSNPGCRFTRDGRAILNYWTCEYLPDWRMQDIIDLRVAILDTGWFYAEAAADPPSGR
jgi:neutral ceramidase